jgi:hypothetical protein
MNLEQKSIMEKVSTLLSDIKRTIMQHNLTELIKKKNVLYYRMTSKRSLDKKTGIIIWVTNQDKKQKDTPIF